MVFCARPGATVPAASVPAHEVLPSMSTCIQAFWLPTVTCTVTPAPGVLDGRRASIAGPAVAGAAGDRGGGAAGWPPAGPAGMARGGLRGRRRRGTGLPGVGNGSSRWASADEHGGQAISSVGVSVRTGDAWAWPAVAG